MLPDARLEALRRNKDAHALSASQLSAEELVERQQGNTVSHQNNRRRKREEEETVRNTVAVDPKVPNAVGMRRVPTPKELAGFESNATLAALLVLFASGLWPFQ